MSGVGLSELILLFVIGLLILGPERMPRVASQIGRWVGRARRTANQLRYQLEREIALAEVEKKQGTGRQADTASRTAAAPPADSAAGASADSAAAPGGAGDGVTRPADATRQEDGSA